MIVADALTTAKRKIIIAQLVRATLARHDAELFDPRLQYRLNRGEVDRLFLVDAFRVPFADRRTSR